MTHKKRIYASIIVALTILIAALAESNQGLWRDCTSVTLAQPRPTMPPERPTIRPTENPSRPKPTATSEPTAEVTATLEPRLIPTVEPAATPLPTPVLMPAVLPRTGDSEMPCHYWMFVAGILLGVGGVLMRFVDREAHYRNVT
jgi:hypothetical protein